MGGLRGKDEGKEALEKVPRSVDLSIRSFLVRRAQLGGEQIGWSVLQLSSCPMHSPFFFML